MKGNCRLIARLDVKGENLIKGIHFEGIRIIGSPEEHARKYYEAGADELIYMDTVASLYGRNNLMDVVSATVEHVFIPLCVGGGLRSETDVQRVLRAGADKVAINTAATQSPELISAIANRFGAQCMVLNIEAKKVGEGRWEAYCDNGREPTGRDVVAWAEEAVSRGAGEILLTSIDRDGTGKGLDLPLIRMVSERVDVPVIASGGVGSCQDIVDGFDTGCDAVATGYGLHFKKFGLENARDAALASGIPVRRFARQVQHA